MEEHRHRLWHRAREYITHWSVAGAIIAITGAAPEHWLAEIGHGLHLPHEVIPAWLEHIDLRLIIVAVGLTIIVGDNLWRNHRGSAAAGAKPGVEPASGLASTAAAMEPAPVQSRADLVPLPDKPSIAVLPFTNMSGDPEQEYFSDGIADDIITDLSRSTTLLVIARGSSFTYKGSSVDVKQVSRELGARYVLQGSVRHSGDRLRINAQLVDPFTGDHLWAQRFDRGVGDLFAVQDEITRAAALAIEPAITQAERQRLARKPPENLGAWEAYQQALWHLSMGSDDGRTKARGLLERALALDPSFADAYAALSAIYRDARARDLGFSPEENLEHAEANARKALELAPDNPVALAALAWVVFHRCRQDREAALQLADEAIDRNPNYAGGHMAKAHILVFDGRAEDARVALETVLRLDPRGQEAIAALHHMAVGCYFSRNYLAAERAARRVLRDHPEFPRAHLVLAAALGQLGRTDEARPVLQRAQSVSSTYFAFVIGQKPPWYRAEDYAHLMEGLRKAGWQD